MTDAANDLLDRYWAYHAEADDRRTLWDSEIEDLERWPATALATTDERRRRLLRFRDEAERGVAVGGADEPSLQTVADAAFLLAAKQDVETELMYPHPRIGLHSYLYWAVNNFPLVEPEHGRRYLDKLAGFPAALDELCERLQAAAEADRAPLARHSREAVAQLDRHLAAASGTTRSWTRRLRPR